MLFLAPSTSSLAWPALPANSLFPHSCPATPPHHHTHPPLLPFLFRLSLFLYLQAFNINSFCTPLYLTHNQLPKPTTISYTNNFFPLSFLCLSHPLQPQTETLHTSSPRWLPSALLPRSSSKTTSPSAQRQLQPKKASRQAPATRVAYLLDMAIKHLKDPSSPNSSVLMTLLPTPAPTTMVVKHLEHLKMLVGQTHPARLLIFLRDTQIHSQTQSHDDASTPRLLELSRVF